MGRILACGGSALLLMLLLGWLIGQSIRPIRSLGSATACRSNLRDMALAFRLYATDYDDRLPPASQWMDRIAEQLKYRESLRCPAVSGEEGKRFGYAFSRTLSGKELARIPEPESRPMVYDSTDPARNAHDASSSLPIPGRHRAQPKRGERFQPGNNVGYADGRVRFRSDGEDISP